LVWAETLVVLAYRKLQGYLDRQRGIVRPTILFVNVDLAKEEMKCME
jgi:hypothetical protein